MDLIIMNDGMFSLVEVTKEMLSQMKIVAEVDCFDLCDIIRLQFTDYLDIVNLHQMKDGSGNFFGCICNS